MNYQTQEVPILSQPQLPLRMEIVWHFKQEHQAPANCACECDAFYSIDRYEDEGENYSEGRLDECRYQRDLHIPHAAEESLDTVGERGENIEECHHRQVAAAF